MRTALFTALALLVTGCQSDPLCHGRTAADFALSAERFRSLTAREREDDARRFNDLARRCGWEP